MRAGSAVSSRAWRAPFIVVFCNTITIPQMTARRLFMPPLEGTQTVELLGFRPHLNPGVKPTLKTKIAFHPGRVSAVFCGYPVTL